MALGPLSDRRNLTRWGDREVAAEASHLGWWVLVLVLCLAFVASFFPPLNWPDERRNLILAAQGDYGLVYSRFLSAVRYVAAGFIPLDQIDADATAVGLSDGWATMHGSLKYDAQPLLATHSYYLAKSANIVVVVAACAVATVGMRGDDPSRNFGTRTFLLCLLVPSVSYQLMQVSTDILFILMSVALYFVRSQMARLLFVALCVALIVEDRSFAILAVISVLYLFASQWSQGLSRFAKWGRARRTLVLLIIVSSGAFLGTSAGIFFQSGTSALQGFLAGFSGFGDVSGQLSATHERNYSVVESPILLIAGLIYMPGATEWVLRTAPVYVLGIPIVWKVLSIATDRSDPRSATFYSLLSATLFTFALITTATHVFESGRYYFALIPLMVVAYGSILGNSGYFLESKRVAGWVGASFAGVTVVYTSLIGLSQWT